MTQQQFRLTTDNISCFSWEKISIRSISCGNVKGINYGTKKSQKLKKPVQNISTYTCEKWYKGMNHWYVWVFDKKKKEGNEKEK